MPIGVFPIEPVDVKTTTPVTIDGGSLGIAGTPVIFNVSMPTASSEYSQLLPTGTKAFEIKSRNNSVLQLAYSAGQTGTDYIKIPGGSTYAKDLLNMTGVTVYLQANVAGEVAQITAWV